MVATLQLVKRQDLLFSTFAAVVGLRDTVTLEFFLPDGVLPPVVLAVAARAEAKAMLNLLQDLKDFTTLQDSSKILPQQLSVLADSSETVRGLLTEDICSLLSDARLSFKSLHITDSNTLSSHTSVVRLVLLMGDYARLEKLTRLAFVLLDKAISFRLSDKQKVVAERQRSLVREKELRESHADRQEQAKERKEERARKKREEQEQLLKKLTGPERQRLQEAIDAKERKHAARARERAARGKVLRVMQ
eukprot:TRINITY_DN1160_c0_g1_i1.p1 TRINITY_DN1160_c0_g1~~TRINITY_DN1160_c0_g1_i1.p1  ORF type:complete len:248 (+),score=45.92 TRINITY_DN1160_c0_g1_i1:513-1256(+)